MRRVVPPRCRLVLNRLVQIHMLGGVRGPQRNSSPIPIRIVMHQVLANHGCSHQSDLLLDFPESCCEESGSREFDSTTGDDLVIRSIAIVHAVKMQKGTAIMNRMLIANPTSMPERCRSFLQVGQAAAHCGRPSVKAATKTPTNIRRNVTNSKAVGVAASLCGCS